MSSHNHTTKVKRSVLLVDDSKINRLLTESILEQLEEVGEYFAVQSGGDAIEILQVRNFDICLLDLHMPDLNGYQTLQQIQLLSVKPPTVFVALSATSKLKDRDKCFEIGFNDFIEKPISTEDVEDVIDRWFTNRDFMVGKRETDPSRHFDDEAFQKSFNLDVEAQELIKSEIKKFLNEVIDWVPIAMKEKEPEKLHSYAHKIKGTSLNLRLPIMAEITTEINLQTKNGFINQKLLSKIKEEAVYLREHIF